MLSLLPRRAHLVQNDIVRRAAIDVGSNSVLTTVLERTQLGWRSIFESSVVTALGEGTKASGLLNPDAIERTLTAISEGFGEAKNLGAERITVAATMAARIARNAEDLTQRASDLGMEMIILSGEEEARLGFLAVVNDPKFADASRVSIIDPGGHSTEMVTADRDSSEPGGWKTQFSRSFPIGTLALIGENLSQECPDGLDLMRAAREMDDVIGLCYLPGQHGSVVTLGATGTNLITLREQMVVWNAERVHGQKLEYEEISRAVTWLSNMTRAERGRLIGMEPGRENTLHAGCLILERFLFALRAESCYVSTRGWRHALIEQD